MERSFIFFPDPRVDVTPEAVGLRYEDVYFATADSVRLNGWFVPRAEAQATLLWFHGNAGNISHRLENIRLLHETISMHILIFDYRGYGRSEGTVSEEGTYRDAQAALRYLRSKTGLDSEKIIFFGRSLGAAVAADLATRHEPLALILESPFTSIRDMARLALPFLPVGLFLRTRYDTLTKMTQVRVPLLVLHGDADEIVPLEQGRKVFEAAVGSKEFYTIPGAHHNDTYVVGGAPYFEALKSFVDRVVSPSVRQP